MWSLKKYIITKWDESNPNDDLLLKKQEETWVLQIKNNYSV